ncbi:YcjF family protein [Richelia sinica]
MKLRRPILVGGLGLSFSLWMLDSWHDSIVRVGEFGLLSALAVGGGLWLLKQNRPVGEQLDDMLVDRASVESAIAKTTAIINQLVQEAVNHPTLTKLREQLNQLHWELERKELKFAVTGGKSVGKTTLVNVLNNVEDEYGKSLHLTETAPLFTDLHNNSDAVTLSAVTEADMVLFLTNGDLTDSEFQVLQQLKTAKQPTLLVFNKQDQYMPDERGIVLQSLQQRVQGDVVATAASPVPVKVRKHQADGSVQEWMEQPAPDIQQLTQRLAQVVAEQGQQLVNCTTMRKTLALKAEAHGYLNGVRRDRSTPIIEQYQWISAAAAFANPIPALDILATAAINAQMVMDLGKIYQQKFSLEQAQTVAATMGSFMLKLGLVELSTKAVTGILKTNAATFVAGGLVEGVSAAYLTRVAGLSLIAYFEQQEIAIDTGNALNLDQLRQVLQTVFQQNQKLAFLEGFVKQGVKHLLPDAQPVATVV